MEATLEDRAVIEAQQPKSVQAIIRQLRAVTRLCLRSSQCQPKQSSSGDANCARCHGAACGKARYAGHYRSVVLIGSAHLWSVMTSTPYRSVSDGMESADVQLAFEALKSANYDVRINKSTGRLEVQRMTSKLLASFWLHRKFPALLRKAAWAL